MSHPKLELTPGAAWALLESEGLEALLAVLEEGADLSVYALLERCTEPPASVH